MGERQQGASRQGGSRRGGQAGPGWTTPARLRGWAAVLVALIAVEFVLVIASVASTGDSVRTIGQQAAPEAATAADLYTALSDMDTQVARAMLVGDAEQLSAVQYDALRGYAQRTTEVDQDLARAARAGDASAEGSAHTMLDELSQYQTLAGQALQLDQADVDAAPGRPPAAAFSYYSQATDLMHFQLLPAAASLRSRYVAALDRTYRSRHGGVEAAAIATGASGLLLVVLLVACQTGLARRHRRRVNPALALATVLVLVITALGASLFAGEAGRLGSAERDAFQPYLVLSRAGAISVTAEADTSRYLIAPGLDYERDFGAQSARLVGRGTGGGLLGGIGPARPTAPGTTAAAESAAGGETLSASGPRGSSLAERWLAYRGDNARIVALAASGRLPDAVTVATGIARHDADFDFSYYDDALDALTAADLSRFDASVTAARHALDAWTLLPPLGFGLAALLVLLGIRPRLAEYR